MIDFDALVLGPCQDAFGGSALLTPLKSQPGVPGYAIRGIFALKGADITTDGEVLRADALTFGVRASEFAVLAQRGDQVSGITHPSFQRFLDGRVFLIEDTGDDGMGNQEWVLKELDTAEEAEA